MKLLHLVIVSALIAISASAAIKADEETGVGELDRYPDSMSCQTTFTGGVIFQEEARERCVACVSATNLAFTYNCASVGGTWIADGPSLCDCNLGDGNCTGKASGTCVAPNYNYPSGDLIRTLRDALAVVGGPLGR